MKAIRQITLILIRELSLLGLPHFTRCSRRVSLIFMKTELALYETVHEIIHKASATMKEI